MKTGQYCPVTGLRVNSDEKWTDIAVGNSLRMSYYSIGNSILYSAPAGRADISGADEALELYRGALESLVPDSNNYVHIEDFNSLGNSGMEVRKLYAGIISGSPKLSALIFCNVSPRMQIGLKMAAQFHITGKKIYFCRDYPEAIALAAGLSGEKNIPADTEDSIPEISGLSDSAVLKPVKVVSGGKPWIKTGKLTNPVYVIDDDIFFSNPSGRITVKDLSVLETAWQEAKSLMEPGKAIRYILLDVNRIESVQSNVHRAYGKFLRSIYKEHPIRLYTTFSSPEKFKHVSRIANSLMPFDVKTAANFREAWRLIQSDKDEKKRIAMPNTQMVKKDELLEFLYNIDWKKPGVEIPADEGHPQYTAMTAFKLMKEETDILFEENREKEAALQQAAEEKQHLLHELQHRVKNSFSLMISMIQLEKSAGLSADTMQVLTKLEHKFAAISDMYELLDFNSDIENITLDEYLDQLIRRHSTAQSNIGFHTSFDEVRLHQGLITPIGLIVTELITNSVKHAFKKTGDKEIGIVLRKTDSGFILEYSDNGTGFNSEKSDPGGTGLGRILLSALAEQISASIYYPEGEGFHCTIVKDH